MPEGKPNILVLWGDDIGWYNISHNNRGAMGYRTPNIDRMAAEGIAFEQFYVNSPICSPSRVAISTGQYPQRWGITSYLARRGLNRERGMSVVYTSHYMEEVELLCTRVAIIDQGRNISPDQPDSVVALRPSQGPSHSREYWRSGAILPSLRESPSATLNQ